MVLLLELLVHKEQCVCFQVLKQGMVEMLGEMAFYICVYCCSAKCQQGHFSCFQIFYLNIMVYTCLLNQLVTRVASILEGTASTFLYGVLMVFPSSVIRYLFMLLCTCGEGALVVDWARKLPADRIFSCCFAGCRSMWQI